MLSHKFVEVVNNTYYFYLKFICLKLKFIFYIFNILIFNDIIFIYNKTYIQNIEQL